MQNIEKKIYCLVVVVLVCLFIYRGFFCGRILVESQKEWASIVTEAYRVAPKCRLSGSELDCNGKLDSVVLKTNELAKKVKKETFCLVYADYRVYIDTDKKVLAYGLGFDPCWIWR